ncbi:hypothetical protein L7F22_054755 [Adiantum nelumboides]|nr:hypothetical protein [Adiantum nelumboides]
MKSDAARDLVNPTQKPELGSQETANNETSEVTMREIAIVLQQTYLSQYNLNQEDGSNGPARQFQTNSQITNTIEELKAEHSETWQHYKKALKEEYFLEDKDRVTKQTFLKWIELRDKAMTAPELLWEFEKRIDQFFAKEQRSLEAEKVELFVEAADASLQKSLIKDLKDLAGELGLTTTGKGKFKELCKWEKQYVCNVSELQGCDVIEPDELTTGVLEEVSFADIMADLEDIAESKVEDREDVVKIHSIDMYEMIAEFQSSFLEDAAEAQVDTKYKTAAKKVKLVATPLQRKVIRLWRRKFKELCKWEKQYVCNVQSELQGCDVIEPEELITGVLEEVSFADTMADLEDIAESRIEHGEDVVKIHSIDMYEMIAKFQSSFLEDAAKAQVDTKYKTVAKKVKLVVAPLHRKVIRLWRRFQENRALGI